MNILHFCLYNLLFKRILVHKTSKKAFSLIELIFVIAILGIIAAVAVPKLMDSKSNAVVSSIKQDISTITTAIQSHYMLNNEIEKISDSVNINESVWEVSDKKVEYKIDDKLCVTIEVTDSKLNVDISESSHEICQEIYKAGIKDTSYDLF